MTGKSMDLVAENVAQLKALFPEAVTEGKIDFEVLKALLGEEIEKRQTYYKFTWNGKEEARAYARVPSMGTLRPYVAESSGKDGTPGKFDSENLYIEGDNLEVLKLLQGAYHKRVKMIYIDPPYNTGHDFVYPDNFKDSLANYKSLTGQTDDEGKSTRANPETSGRYHTDWLNMMYPRLILARNLLTDDGVIFISIDDSEQDNLKKLCNEVFGEENFIEQIVWQKRTSPDARKIISSGHEYLLIYSKNKENIKSSLNLLDLSEDDKKAFKNPDNDPRGPWVSSDFTAQGYRPNQMYTIKTPGGAKYTPSPGHCWKNIESLFLQQVSEGRFWFGTDGNGMPRRKTYLAERQGKNLWTWWPNNEVGHTQEATQEVKLLFNGISIFDFPKPVRLLFRAIQMASKKDDIILDFFSGTAVTAHAVMQLNAEDGGNRKFIMVQLPEVCEEGTEAAKAGYKNICEIGKERIRRAGRKSLELRVESLVKELGLESFAKEGLLERLVPDKNHGGENAGELSETGSLEEIYGGCCGNLSACEEIAQGGDIRIVGSDAAGGSVDSLQYRGRTGAGNKGVHPVFENGTGITCGAGNTIVDLCSLELLKRLGYRVKLESIVRNQQDDLFPDSDSQFKTQLSTLNSKLSALNSKLSALNSKLSALNSQR